jgi:hypothetical protein
MPMMAKKLTIFVLVIFISSQLLGAKSARKKLLPDGFALNGIDGKLLRADSNESKTSDKSETDRWFFEFDSDLNTERGSVKAGAKIELLPSSALEKMTSDAKERTTTGYRLWARVTKYRDKNFIFPIYFLPTSTIKQPEQTTEQTEQQPPSPVINEPNDQLTIPEELIEKLSTRRIVRPEQLRKGLELKQDSVLADRTAFIVRQLKNNSKSGFVLVLDALGRNVPQVKLELLACEALERAIQIQSAEPDPVRFKIAGILTQYKGNFYLLLQQATRIYSHGNFPG